MVLMNKITIVVLTLAVLLLSACASGPKYETSGINLHVTPAQAVNEITSLRGISVLWGGIIIASINLKDDSQLEILAYPLDSSQRPDLSQKPLGRFLARQSGYLELADYTQGRLLTVLGQLQDRSIGKVGESEYYYPVVRVDKHYLWNIGNHRRIHGFISGSV